MTDSFFTALENAIADKHLLTHPFYQAWTKGQLSKECLHEYALQYYHHVKAFPRYLSALHSHTEESATRKLLLQNLIDEEAGAPNHPELWRNFILKLGVEENRINLDRADSAIQTLIETFQEICKSGSTAEGLAALYAYESQIPAISESKIEGLKAHYCMKSPEDWSYFTVHIDADKEHAAVEKKLLLEYVNEENQHRVLQAADRVLNQLWNFLTSLCHKYQIASSCA